MKLLDISTTKKRRRRVCFSLFFFSIFLVQFFYDKWFRFFLRLSQLNSIIRKRNSFLWWAHTLKRNKRVAFWKSVEWQQHGVLFSRIFCYSRGYFHHKGWRLHVHRFLLINKICYNSILFYWTLNRLNIGNWMRRK